MANLISLSLKEQFRRSVLMADVEERQQKIAAIEQAQEARRDTLIVSLGALAYHAEQAKYRLEQKQWKRLEDDSLFIAVESARDAITALNEGEETIAEHNRQIEDLQRDLNDAALWDEEVR